MSEAGKKLGLEGTYIARSYIEQIQLAKLTASFQNVTADLRRRFVVDGEPLLDEHSLGASPRIESHRRISGFSPQRLSHTTSAPLSTSGASGDPGHDQCNVLTGFQSHSLCFAGVWGLQFLPAAQTACVLGIRNGSAIWSFHFPESHVMLIHRPFLVYSSRISALTELSVEGAVTRHLETLLYIPSVLALSVFSHTHLGLWTW